MTDAATVEFESWAQHLPKPRMSYEQRKARSLDHAANPQPGDYWHDCFSPAALVLEVGTFNVTLLRKIKAAGDGWTWDTTDVSVMSRAAFKEWLHYSSRAGTWAQVEPKWRHFEDFRDEAMQHALGVKGIDGKPKR